MNADETLRAYILLLHLKTSRDGVPFQYLKECQDMTPAEITKLTEHAKRAKALMAQSSNSSKVADKVLTNYESTLNAFDSQIQRVSKEDAALKATLAEMGNAVDNMASDFISESLPKETAHLNEKK